MKTSVASVAACLLGFALAAAGAEKSSSEAFIKDAMEGNLWEVQVGQLAQTQAADPDVRQFGATLNMSHGEATRKAATAAQAIGVKPPTRLSSKHQAKYDRLSKLSGEQFDRQFLQQMVEDHKEDIAKYETQAKAGKDAVAEYAKETLPALRRHLQTAQTLQGKKGG